VEMATALAAVRLQPWPQQQPDVVEVHKYVDVVHGMRELGSSGVRMRAFGGYPSKGVGSSQQPRLVSCFL